MDFCQNWKSWFKFRQEGDKDKPKKMFVIRMGTRRYEMTRGNDMSCKKNVAMSGYLQIIVQRKCK